MTLAGTLDRKLILTLQPKNMFEISPLPAKRCSTFVQCPWLQPGVMLLVKCSSSSEAQPDGGGLKNTLSNIANERVEELLGRKENKALLDKLNKASERVELAKKQLADIHRQELESQQLRLYINQLETRASEISECQQEVMEARAMVEEAERYLSDTGSSNSDKINRDEERWESVKAGAIAALVGTLAVVPIYNLSSSSNGQAQLLLQLGITFATCALFGVTFRYAVRRDLDNIQLKYGTSAAFAFVKGLATLNGGAPLELNSASILAHALDGVSFVSLDLFIFIFVAVSLDFCFKTRIISPFPITKKF